VDSSQESVDKTESYEFPVIYVERVDVIVLTEVTEAQGRSHPTVEGKYFLGR